MHAKEMQIFFISKNIYILVYLHQLADFNCTQSNMKWPQASAQQFSIP